MKTQYFEESPAFFVLCLIAIIVAYMAIGYIQGKSYEECLSKGNSEKTCAKATLN
jgi:hypothetical protein